MNLKNVILIGFFAVWTLITYGNESGKLLATRFVATTETGVHKYELEQTNKSLKNKKVYLYYCDKTGCVFISREESVAVINGPDPVIISLSGNVIKFLR